MVEADEMPKPVHFSGFIWQNIHPFKNKISAPIDVQKRI